MHPNISDPAAYRAALYIRLSREDESDGPSQSVTNQRSLLDEFVRQQRLSVHDVYIDDGFSGTTFDRPAFQRMIADIEAGKVNMVITKDLSRLGRDYILTGHYMERYFPEKRVRYISLLDGIDTGVESVANDFTPFRAILNDMYARDISRKIRAVKHDKQRSGRFIGGKPMYGYRKHPTEKNRIVPDEPAAQIVRRMFSLAAEGVSCRQIAIRLNEEGVPPPAVYAGLTPCRGRAYSGRWSSERVSEMLRSEVYLGRMVQGRSARVSYKSKKCARLPQESWIVVDGTHEPLVSRSMFDRAQQMIRSRRHTRTRTYDFLLKGLIFCHECQSPMAVVNRPAASGADRLFLICRTYQRFSRTGACTCHAIREETVTGAVCGKLREFCSALLRADRLIPLAEAALESGRAADDEAQPLRSRLERLNAQLDQSCMARLEGLVSEADFARVYARLARQRAALEEKLRLLDAQRKSPVHTRDRAEELVRRYLAAACLSRELLVSLIERVEVTEEKHILIRFRCRKPDGAP